jgi:hypothetical protein
MNVPKPTEKNVVYWVYPECRYTWEEIVEHGNVDMVEDVKRVTAERLEEWKELNTMWKGMGGYLALTPNVYRFASMPRRPVRAGLFHRLFPDDCRKYHDVCEGVLARDAERKERVEEAYQQAKLDYPQEMYQWEEEHEYILPLLREVDEKHAKYNRDKKLKPKQGVKRARYTPPEPAKPLQGVVELSDEEYFTLQNEVQPIINEYEKLDARNLELTVEHVRVGKKTQEEDIHVPLVQTEVDVFMTRDDLKSLQKRTKRAKQLIPWLRVMNFTLEVAICNAKRNIVENLE